MGPVFQLSGRELTLGFLNYMEGVIRIEQLSFPLCDVYVAREAQVCLEQVVVDVIKLCNLIRVESVRFQMVYSAQIHDSFLPEKPQFINNISFY